MKIHKNILSFRIFLCTLFLFIVVVSCTKHTQTGLSGTETKNITDSTLFLTKTSNSGELPSYGCVRLRRGDRIELKGTVSKSGTGTQEHTVLTTSAGRVFILIEGKDSIPPAGTFSVKSIIQFEGNDQRLPELSVLSFHRIKKP